MARFNFTRSRNPIMKESVYQRSSAEIAAEGEERMTVQGAINKTYVLFAILSVTAFIGWNMASPVIMWIGAIAGLITLLICVFKTHLSPTLAPLYAAFEGLFVGAISGFYAGLFSGIIMHAVTLTIAILFLMLFLYKSGLVKVTQKFRTGVIMATGAVLVVYLLSFALSFFGINMPYIHEGGIIGIGISLVIIGIASLNLLLDFDNFEKGEQMGAPKYMEWFSAMGLMVTLVWLYIEILRLLAILNRD